LYYFDESEVRFLTQELLPRARSEPVDERLRGWNWNQSPLKPYSYEIQLSVWEIASRTCPTNRDVWIRRNVLKRSVPTTIYIVKGIIIHRMISNIFKYAKKLVYLGEIDDLRKKLIDKAMSIYDDEVSGFKQHINVDEVDKGFREFCKQVAIHTSISIENKLYEVRAKYPFLDEEGVVNLVFPFSVELIIDGSFLGLSRYLRADASWMFGGLVYDVKTGYKLEWHKIQIAGYALAIESFYERPVDVGALIYVNPSPYGLNIVKDLFLITDNLRSKFIEIRDELQMLLLKNKEPPLPENCPKSCIFRKYCLGE